MKKTSVFLVAVIAVVLTGCSKQKSMMNVRLQFPSAQIETSPSSRFEYIVKDGTNIYYVYSNGDVVCPNNVIIPLFGSTPVKCIMPYRK